MSNNVTECNKKCFQKEKILEMNKCLYEAGIILLLIYVIPSKQRKLLLKAFYYLIFDP